MCDSCRYKYKRNSNIKSNRQVYDICGGWGSRVKMVIYILFVSNKTFGLKDKQQQTGKNKSGKKGYEESIYPNNLIMITKKKQNEIFCGKIKNLKQK